MPLEAYNSNLESLGEKQIYLYIYKEYDGYINGNIPVYCVNDDDEAYATYHYAYSGNSDIYVSSSDVCDALES
jgi:hypothetical protein